MNRGKFAEQILRIAFNRGKRDTQRISDHLEDLIKQMVKTCQSSLILKERDLIQNDKKVSSLLRERHLKVTELYDEPFTFRKAIAKYGEESRECFIFSKQTIVNEHRQSPDYQKLHFIEFQEFLCRNASRTEGEEPLEYKLDEFL